MATPTILKIPKVVLQAILKECRTWYHPSVKNKGAAPIDFGTYSDFHLRLDYVKYLPVFRELQSTEHRPEIASNSPKHTAQFTTLILTNYGRCYRTLESLIRWPRRLEHFSFTLRFGFESLYLNDIHMGDGPMAGQIVQKLHDMLEPHRTTLKSLRIGLALTPVAYAMAYMPGFDYPAGANFGLDHGMIPDFRDYRNLQHLHIASIFTGHQDFCDRWRFRSESCDLDELHRDVDRLLAPTLYRITLDVGCEFSLRHCPCFPLDIEEQPVCDLLCPLDQDLFAFLVTLARRAKYRRARLCQIHVNYCVRPFALPMPASDLPEGFGWEWIPQYHYFDPWEWLERVKRRVERLGILLTYTGLEPVCGMPRTHIPIPKMSFDMSVTEWLQLCRQHDLQLFNYEDEMCSEHVWTVVKSG
ncbi:hypothetical protein QR685DRAFT_434206 [Neurospora intermedia]|uniref:Uncharacterized protein n=1 Tax=Neurospora intermedia TaxID=5142 RepID=A0ABR3DUL2_NEUIN